jgi:hypothetical protein
MHLGLIDEPLVSHNLISAQESPVPLLKLQMAPRLKILMSSKSKKGTQAVPRLWYVIVKSKIVINKSAKIKKAR